MTLKILLIMIGLLVGFAGGRWLSQSRLAGSQRRSRMDEIDDTRRIFAGLSNDQQWLVARLIDEKNFPVGDWNDCLDAVVFVERDEAAGKRRGRATIKPRSSRSSKSGNRRLASRKPMSGFRMERCSVHPRRPSFERAALAIVALKRPLESLRRLPC